MVLIRVNLFLSPLIPVVALYARRPLEVPLFLRPATASELLRRMVHGAHPR
jgi:hypothetical protein